MQPELKRQTFTVSRELEYFSEKELVTQTGYAKQDWWPRVLVKELVDNGLDAAEQTGVAPSISVSFKAGELIVSDNGPGLPSSVIDRILDFRTRTSDKAAYVSPTRGAQGNALKTILAIPYVLNEGKPATVVIEAQGIEHRITIETDHLNRRPAIEHSPREIVKKPGTVIRIRLNSACSKAGSEDPDFLQRLLFDYSLFNPHAEFILLQDGAQHRFPATNPAFHKWLPSDPTSAHWYSVEQFEELIASYIAAESSGGRSLTVRELVAEFRGLSSTLKQKCVVTEAGLHQAYLHDLVSQRKLNRPRVERLLTAMQQASSPVKPDALGALGEPHFRQRLQMPEKKEDKSFRYKRQMGTNEQGPYIVECAFAMTDNPLVRGTHIGLNWSPPLSNPLQDNHFALGDDKGGRASGLSGLLWANRIDLDSDDPVSFVLHLISPRFNFLDRGKGSVSL